jgi:hypothetical protein
MILTALSHALITALCGLVGWYFGELGIGLAAGLAFYFGREVAQHERKTRGTAIRGLFVWNWNLDAQLDMLFPIIAAVGLLIIERML